MKYKIPSNSSKKLKHLVFSIRAGLKSIEFELKIQYRIILLVWLADLKFQLEWH